MNRFGTVFVIVAICVIAADCIGRDVFDLADVLFTTTKTSN